MSYRLTTYPIRRPSVRKSYRPLLRVLRLEPLPAHRRSYERRVYAHAEPLPLEIAGRRKIVAYACGHCGSVHSLKPGLYNSGPDNAWRRALECCRRPRDCAVCGTALDRDASTTCNRCWSIRLHREERARARKAEIVADTGDPVCDPLWQGEWGDGYSPSLADHVAWWDDEHGTDEPAPDDAPEPPAFVYATTPVYGEIDIEQIAEHLTEEMHEDASAWDLYGFDLVEAAVAGFNKAQREPNAWMVDYSRAIVIDPARFAAYLGTDWDGTPDIRWRDPRRDTPTRNLCLQPLLAPSGAPCPRALVPRDAPGAATSEVPG